MSAEQCEMLVVVSTCGGLTMFDVEHRRRNSAFAFPDERVEGQYYANVVPS